MVLGDLLDLELKQKWAPKHSLLRQKTGKKIPNGKPGPKDSTFYGIFCRQSISFKYRFCMRHMTIYTFHSESTAHNFIFFFSRFKRIWLFDSLRQTEYCQTKIIRKFTEVQIKVVNHMHINLAKEQNLLIGEPFACKHPNQKSKFWF